MTGTRGDRGLIHQVNLTKHLARFGPDPWVRPDRVFDGTRLLEGVVLHLESGKVSELADVAPEEANVLSLPGTVTPGFVDLQVNGGGDTLFNAAPTPEGIATILSTHRRLGTAGILPTVITDAPDVLARAVEAVEAAWGISGLLGIHIEGPHISTTRRGTHAERFIRPMCEETLAHVKRLRKRDIPVMITLAPEAVTTREIVALAGTGAVVSIGHTDATAKDARAALDAGATCFTHLFNAMSPMLNRAPGVVGAAINSSAYAGIICDGIHVADEMVSLAIRARPVSERMFLVSDAMPTVGGLGRFQLYDTELRLENGRLVNDEGMLAGAHVTMAESVTRLVTVLGITPETALKMAITIPARLIGMAKYAQLVGRSIDEVVLLPREWSHKDSPSRNCTVAVNSSD